MKRKLRVLSMLMAAVLVVQLCTSVAFATYNRQLTPDVYHYELNEENRSAEAVMQVNNNLFYTYGDENFSYCAQMLSGERIQFSYYQIANDRLVESEIYEIEDIYLAYSIERNNDQNFLALNRTIIDNIESFSNVHVVDGVSITGAGVMAAAYGDSLDDAIEAEFGRSYTGLSKGSLIKTYSGTTYTVRCTESQTTSYTTPDSRWFTKDTAVSTIVAWAIAGSWTWKALLLSLICTVVTTVTVNGVEKTVNNFTAERTNVSLMHTRLVTVDGYSGTQYWAGWTRKYYFFKGEDEWVCDSGYNWNVKHPDFDDSSSLLATGWNNFVNYLTGGY